MLNKYIFISFDIFDTLIKRNVMNPKDIFTIVQERYNYKEKHVLENFVTNRIITEKNLRKNKEIEITIDEIYDEMKLIYGKDIAEKLKILECETEIDLCCPNLEIKKIYDNCIKMNKKILIISDMYLDRVTITKMLDKCGYFKYKKLYISSEFGETKQSGKLYDIIKNDLKIDKKQWIHIGDNKKSDYNNALKYGISAIHIPTVRNNLKYTDIRQNDNSIESRVNATLNNLVEKDFGYFKQLGYETLGPIVIGFINWLTQELERENIEKVYFLSRDGYIIKKVYDILELKNISSNYLYVSRRSLQVPSFYINSNYEDVLDSFFIPRRIEFGTFIKKLGITYEQISHIADEFSLTEDTIIEFKNIKKNEVLKKFYNKAKGIIVNNAEKEYKALVEYLKQNNFNGKVAIIDIGWFGNMQAALTKVTNHASIKAEIYGYYIGLIPEGNLQNKMNMKGYLFSSKHNQDLHLKEKVFNSIFETIFLAQHGSVKKYYLKNNIAHVELFNYECKDKIMERDIVEFQEGAFIFARHWYSSIYSRKIQIDSRFAFRTICNLGLSPDKKSSQKIGDWKFFDIEERFIAKPDNIKKYILNPKKLIIDLNKAPWKIGFLKRMFKIKLPYFKMWMLLRNIYKRFN